MYRKSRYPLKCIMNISVMVHSNQRGGEVMVGHKSHILLWEQGGASQVMIITIYTNIRVDTDSPFFFV